MGLPFNHSNDIPVQNSEKADIKLVMAKLWEKLQAHKAENLKSEGETITFTGGLLRWAGRMNILNPISKAELRFYRKNDMIFIHYDVTFTEYIIYYTLAIWGFFGHGFYFAPNVPIESGLIILSVIYLVCLFPVYTFPRGDFVEMLGVHCFTKLTKQGDHHNLKK